MNVLSCPTFYSGLNRETQATMESTQQHHCIDNKASSLIQLFFSSIANLSLDVCTLASITQHHNIWFYHVYVITQNPTYWKTLLLNTPRNSNCEHLWRKQTSKVQKRVIICTYINKKKSRFIGNQFIRYILSTKSIFSNI